jgi:hypothetical protein
VSLVARFVGKQPMDHASERSNTSAGGDEDGVLALRLENEVTVRTIEVNVVAELKIAQVVRHEAFAHAVQAKIEAIIDARRRSQRVGTGDGFSILPRLAHGDELTGGEVEFRLALYFKLQMLSSVRQDFGFR